MRSAHLCEPRRVARRPRLSPLHSHSARPAHCMRHALRSCSSQAFSDAELCSPGTALSLKGSLFSTQPPCLLLPPSIPALHTSSPWLPSALLALMSGPTAPSPHRSWLPGCPLHHPALRPCLYPPHRPGSPPHLSPAPSAPRRATPLSGARLRRCLPAPWPRLPATPLPGSLPRLPTTPLPTTPLPGSRPRLPATPLPGCPALSAALRSLSPPATPHVPRCFH